MRGFRKWLIGTAAAARIVQVLIAALLGAMGGVAMDAERPGVVQSDGPPSGS